MVGWNMSLSLVDADINLFIGIVNPCVGVFCSVLTYVIFIWRVHVD